ncbi:MAG: hypothetical protein LUE63_01650 [Lachnospiraceae bacterium]|nr:hypothetical protein [Lachnospiraceae bacterium]
MIIFSLTLPLGKDVLARSDSKTGGAFFMMYPFMTLGDKTEVVHSDAYDVNGTETVKVYFEKPVYGGFHSAECYLPSYEWKNIEGFSSEEIENFQEYLQTVAHIVIRLAREGGFDNFAS